MRKVVFLLIASLAIAFTACNKEKIDKVNPADITVNLNKAELQQRIEVLNYPVSFNSLKAGLVTPLPELWAIARILPGDRTYSVFHWKYEDTRDAGSVWYYRTTATNVAPTITLPALPSDANGANLSRTLVVDNSFGGAGLLDHEEGFEETMSMTGAGLYEGAVGVPDFAYFTSHVRGDVYGGEVFAVNYQDNSVNNQGAMQAAASIFDNTADYNDLTIDGSTLWMVGDNNARGAIVRKIDLTVLNPKITPTISAVETSSTYQQATAAVADQLTEYNMPLLGPSGNSVSIFGNQLWVVAGGTSYGGLVVMNKNDATQLFTRTDVHNAKHFDMGTTENASAGAYNGAFLWGDGNFNNGLSNLRIFNTSDGPYAYTDYMGGAYGDVTFEGKNAIDVDGVNGSNQFIYMAMGADGIVKVTAQVFGAFAKGDVVDSYNLTGGLQPSTFGGNGLANGLVVHGDFVYVAWGASGLLIFDKTDLAAGPVGQYNGIGSCNYVSVDTNHSAATGDILFAGFGTGGIVMLKFVDDI